MAVPRLPRRGRLPPTPPPSPRLTLLPPLQKLAIRAESIGRPAARVQGKKSERERERERSPHISLLLDGTMAKYVV